MKTIGLIGGMSWESTVGYYREINEGVKRQLGGLHSAKIVLYSVDFAPIEKLQHNGDWDATGSILADAARSVEAGGAEFLLICTNTMHKVADQVERAVSIPLLHIADATAEVLVHNGVKKIGLLGTAFTMEQEFYKGRLSEKYGVDVIVPDAPDRKLVHDIIYQELCLGHIEPASKREYIRIVKKLTEMGSEGVILGCTEIGMLIGQDDTNTTLYDTTKIHAAKAVEWAI
jgi:aspartate racemase